MGKIEDERTSGDHNPGTLERAGKIIVLSVAVIVVLACIGLFMLISCWGPDHIKC